MALDLKKLGALSNELLNAAIALSEARENSALKDTSFSARKSNLAVHLSDTPYLRLFKILTSLFQLINEDKKIEHHEFELSVLAILMGSENEKENLTNDIALLKAIQIFLSFKVYGDCYVSKNGNGDTCLHDAYKVSSYIDRLIELLVEHGADPDCENENHLTAFADKLQKSLKDRGITEVSELGSSESVSKEKLRRVIKALVYESSFKYIYFLMAIDQMGFFKKHPDLLNFTSGEFQNTILHIAVVRCPPEVIAYLLQQGADPDAQDNTGDKPINDLIDALYDKKTKQESPSEIMALLLIASIKRSLKEDKLSVSHIVIALLKLNIDNQMRRQICEKIFKSESSRDFAFTQKDLLAHLEAELQKLKHDGMRLIEKVGSGTYGQVYSALLPAYPGKKLAVKLSSLEDAQSTISEMAVIERFDHPNIVKSMGAIILDSRMGFIMPLATTSLRAFIGTEPGHIIEACFYPYNYQINAALNYLHRKGYAHLDLTPPNILLDMPDGKDKSEAIVILADFGLSFPLGGVRNHDVMTEWVRGPERFDRKQPYTSENDIFSFGKVMGAMAAEKIPWKDERFTIGSEKTRASITKLVFWCCEKDPSKRPRAEEIEDYLHGHFKPGYIL